MIILFFSISFVVDHAGFVLWLETYSKNFKLNLFGQNCDDYEILFIYLNIEYTHNLNCIYRIQLNFNHSEMTDMSQLMILDKIHLIVVISVV